MLAKVFNGHNTVLVKWSVLSVHRLARPLCSSTSLVVFSFVAVVHLFFSFHFYVIESKNVLLTSACMCERITQFVCQSVSPTTKSGSGASLLLFIYLFVSLFLFIYFLFIYFMFVFYLLFLFVYLFIYLLLFIMFDEITRFN